MTSTSFFRSLLLNVTAEITELTTNIHAMHHNSKLFGRYGISLKRCFAKMVTFPYKQRFDVHTMFCNKTELHNRPLSQLHSPY